MSVTLAISNKKVRKVEAKAKRSTKQLKRQMMMASAIGMVDVALIGLSLSHLAGGIELVTGEASWQSWAMAVGIDCGFMALEMAQMSVGEKLLRQITRFTKPAIFGTMGASAILNGLAFANHAASLPHQLGAAALGVAIPGLIYCLTRVGAAMYIDCHNKG